MSRNFTPAFVYQRKRPHKDPVSISETEPSDRVKTHNGISTINFNNPMSQNFTPNFVYQCKSPHKDSVSISETEPPGGVKPSNGVSQLSTSSTMSQNFTLTFVYQCKRPHKNPISIPKTELPDGISQLSTSSSMSQDLPTLTYQRKRPRKESFSTVEPPNGIKPSNGCQSSVSSEAHAFSVSARAAEDEHPAVGPVKCRTVATVYANTYDNREEFGSGLALNANEHYLSSKSNSERSLGSLKFNTYDADERSSSGSLIEEKLVEEIFARDVCISILRSEGLLDRVWTRQSGASNKNIIEKYCSRPCRVCECMESTQCMLICDNCESAFHVSCYNSRLTVLPRGEWLCHSCLKKKRKILKDKLSGISTNIRNEIGRNRCLGLDGELGSLEFMFIDTEPYMSNVRIGDEFQACVPKWSGPCYGDCNLIGDAMELDPSDYTNIKEGNPIKPLKLSSIGNWLQCRGVIEGIEEGADGTICSKWRRAPLFDVQTDDWECFNCVLWDPAHADCAVPQELDTDEVMKHLKHMETWRQRLSAKSHTSG